MAGSHALVDLLGGGGGTSSAIDVEGNGGLDVGGGGTVCGAWPLSDELVRGLCPGRGGGLF